MFKKLGAGPKMTIRIRCYEPLPEPSEFERDFQELVRSGLNKSQAFTVLAKKLDRRPRTVRRHWFRLQADRRRETGLTQ